MREQTLLDYFNGETSAEMLSKDFLGSIIDYRDTSYFNIKDIKSDIHFCVTAQHLLKLCKDIISSKIPVEDLSIIVFYLESSNHFFWDKETDDGKIVEDMISNWSSLEQNRLKTITYLQYCVFHFESGCHR